MEDLRIGIVVLNYMNWELTEECVDNILALNGALKVVVIDNGSANDSFEKLLMHYKENDSVVVINAKVNCGYASGNNIGLKYICEKYPTIQYLGIVNPDVIIENYDVLLKLIDALEKDSNLAAISPKMNLNGEINPNEFAWNVPNNIEVFSQHFACYKAKKSGWKHIAEHGIYKCEAVPGSFFMIKKEILEAIDFLDENTFLYNEENILAIKVKCLGKYNGICLDCQYLHLHKNDGVRKSLKAVMAGYKAGDQSRLYMCKKYYPKWSYVCLLAICVINKPIIVVRHLLGNIKHKLIG